MAERIFVNLPVKDLPRSMRFFEALGYGFDPRFTDSNAACLVIGPNIYAMLLTEAFFANFTSKRIADTRETIEVLTALGMNSREEVDRLLDRALAAGGVEPRPAQDHGFMFQRSFEDPDGHVWEIFWMDPAGIPAEG